MPYLTPDAIPGTKQCRGLFIPDDPAIVAAVTGAIEELAFAYNWELFGTVTPAEMASAMRDMFDEFCIERRTCKVIGSVFAVATASPPPGTLLCDGQSYERSAYPDLYAVLATPFILDAEAFMVPDLRGRVVAGALQFDTPPFNVGNIFGEVEHFLDESEMPTHAHTINATLTSLAVGPGEVPVQTDIIVDTITGFAGSGGAHNNVQPTVVLNYVIVAEK